MSLPTTPPEASADLVFTGGTVLALDSRNTIASALAVREGRIVFVGSDEDAAAHVGSETNVVDLAGRALLPGINESHLHATWLGAMWPNTLMEMMAAGPAGMANQPGPLATSQARREAILRAGEVAASLGITSYTEPGLGPGEDSGETGACGSDVLEQYRQLAAEGALRARVNVLMLFGVLDGASNLSDFERGVEAMGVAGGAAADNAVQAGVDAAWLRIAGVKIFADGIPPMHGAWIHGQYSDGSHGDLLVEGADTNDRERNMQRMIRLAHERGWQVGVHATGDRSIDSFIDTVAVARAADEKDLRHYVIHGDMITPDALRRLAENGMGVNMQAGLSVATSGMMEAALGEEALAAAWPITGALRAGVPLCLSSDGPVLTPDWRHGIAAAGAWVGDALGDSRETMLELLRCYTVNGAWQDHAEDWKGTLEVGKVADLCILERNPLEVEPADMPSVSVDLTVVGGRVVFEREAAGSLAQ